MAGDDFFTVARLAPSNSDTYSPDYAFLVNVVAVNKGDRSSFVFGTLPSQENANTILNAARGDPLGRTMFRTTEVKPVVKTARGGTQEQFTPLKVFKVSVDPDEVTVYFDPKRQASTRDNYKHLYELLGITLPGPSALDSIIVNPSADPAKFLEQVVKAVASDLRVPGVTIAANPVPDATMTKELSDIKDTRSSFLTRAPIAKFSEDIVMTSIPRVTSIDYFPALVFQTQVPVSITFQGSSPILLPAGFPLVSMSQSAQEFSAVDFVNDYYPPSAVDTVMSPIPLGRLSLTDAKLPYFRQVTPDILANDAFTTARTNLIRYAESTNAISRELIRAISDSAFPAVPPPAPAAPPPRPLPAFPAVPEMPPPPPGGGDIPAPAPVIPAPAVIPVPTPFVPEPVPAPVPVVPEPVPAPVPVVPAPVPAPVPVVPEPVPAPVPEPVPAGAPAVAAPEPEPVPESAIVTAGIPPPTLRKTIFTPEIVDSLIALFSTVPGLDLYVQRLRATRTWIEDHMIDSIAGPPTVITPEEMEVFVHVYGALMTAPDPVDQMFSDVESTLKQIRMEGVDQARTDSFIEQFLQTIRSRRRAPALALELPASAPAPVVSQGGVQPDEILRQMKTFIQSVPELGVTGDTKFTYNADATDLETLKKAVARLSGNAYKLILPTKDASAKRVKYVVDPSLLIPGVRYAIATWNVSSTGRNSWSAAFKAINTVATGQTGGANKPSVVTVQFYIQAADAALAPRPLALSAPAPPATPPPAPLTLSAPEPEPAPAQLALREPEPEPEPEPVPTGVTTRTSSFESIPEVETVMPPGRAQIPIFPESESPLPIPGRIPSPPPVEPAPAPVATPVPTTPVDEAKIQQYIELHGSDVTPEDVLRARNESESKPENAELKRVYDSIALKYRDIHGPTAYATLMGLPTFTPPATNAGRQVAINASRVPKGAVKRIPVRDDGWCFYRAALLGARYSAYGTPEEYAALGAPPTPEVLESLRTFVKQIQEWIQSELAKGNDVLEYQKSIFEIAYEGGYPYQGRPKRMTFDEYVSNLTAEDNGLPLMYPDSGFGVGLAAAHVVKRNIRMLTETVTAYSASETYLADPPSLEPTVLILKEREQAHFDLLIPNLEYRGGRRGQTFKHGRKLRTAKYTQRRQ